MPDMTNKHSSISVIIPTYNCGQYIARAIDSVLAQSHPADEIIVVDDGSTDNTADIVHKYENKVRYIYQDNGGPSVARNTGIQHAQGQWIAFLDSDDCWLPEKLQTQMDLLERNSHLLWCTSNYTSYWYRNDTKKHLVDPKKMNIILNGQEYFDNYFKAVMHGIGWTPSGLIVNRIVFEAVGRFQEGLHFGEDMDLCFRIACRWPDVGFCPQPLFIYTAARPGSLTTNEVTVSQMYILCEVYDRHLKTVDRHGQLDNIISIIIRDISLLCIEMFIGGHGDIIRHLLGRYVNILPMRARMIMTMLVILSLGGFGPVRNNSIGTIHLRSKLYVRNFLRKLLYCS